jgi:peroxiredoxin
MTNWRDAATVVLDVIALVAIVTAFVGIARRRPLPWTWIAASASAVVVAWILYRGHIGRAFLFGVFAADFLLVAIWIKHVRLHADPKRTGVSLALAAACLVGAVSCLTAMYSAYRAMNDYEPLYGVGDVAPEIAGADVDGRAVRSSDHRGKVLLVVFFGDWCGPCRGMYPQERSLAKRMKDEPFVLLGVASDTTDAARAAIARESIDWPVVVDGGCEGPIAAAWDVHAWPTTVLVDARGVIREIHLRGEALDRAVDELVAEAKAAR